MAPTLQQLGLDRLPLDERLLIAEAIWDSVASELEGTEIRATEQAELERRLTDSLLRPEATTPWEVVKARALARAKA